MFIEAGSLGIVFVHIHSMHIQSVYDIVHQTFAYPLSPGSRVYEQHFNLLILNADEAERLPLGIGIYKQILDLCDSLQD